MTPIMQVYPPVQGLSPEFVHALWMMSRERGGGYIPVHEVQARADTLKVIPKLPRLMPLPLPRIGP